MCEDKEVLVYEYELNLLKRVFEKSSDLIKANAWPEFCEINGGINVFEKKHAEATAKLEQWYLDGE